MIILISMKTNRRSLLHALFGFFGFFSLAKGSGQSVAVKPIKSKRGTVFQAEKEVLTSARQSDSSPRTPTKIQIQYDALGRIVERVDYYDEVPIGKSVYEYRNS
jgi:hypothetical protein